MPQGEEGHAAAPLGTVTGRMCHHGRGWEGCWGPGTRPASVPWEAGREEGTSGWKTASLRPQGSQEASSEGPGQRWAGWLSWGLGHGAVATRTLQGRGRHRLHPWGGWSSEHVPVSPVSLSSACPATPVKGSDPRAGAGSLEPGQGAGLQRGGGCFSEDVATRKRRARWQARHGPAALGPRVRSVACEKLRWVSAGEGGGAGWGRGPGAPR